MVLQMERLEFECNELQHDRAELQKELDQADQEVLAVGLDDLF